MAIGWLMAVLAAAPADRAVATVIHVPPSVVASCPVATDGDVVVCAHSDTPPGNVVAMEVNGRRGRLLVDPGGPDDPNCNADFVRAAGIANTAPRPLGHVGPVTIVGAVAEMRWTVDGRSTTRRVGWSLRQAVVGADCVVGPSGMPNPVVRFVIRPDRPGAPTVVLPFYAQPPNEHDGSTDAWLGVGKVKVAVRLDLQRPETVITAPATMAVVRTLGGVLEGPLVTSEIVFGIHRPVRRLRTFRPIAIGPLTIAAPYARVSDYGDATGVRSIDPDEVDEGDVVVAARAGTPRGHKIIRVGRDDLDRCSAIEFDRRARTIALTC